MEYLTFSGELLDNFISIFYKLKIGKRYTCHKYSICSCAHETIIIIKLNRKISINIFYENTCFSNIEITERKFLTKKKHPVFGLNSIKEYTSFNDKNNLKDTVILLLSLTTIKLKELGIDFKIEGNVGNG